MASDVALYLREKLMVSFRDVKTQLSDLTFQRVENIIKHIEDDVTFLTGPESISLLYKLHDDFADWRILRDQKNFLKGFFSFIDEAQINEALAAIENKINEAQGSRKKPIQPDFLLDRFTIYNFSSSDILGFDEHAKAMVKCLWESGKGFKAIGIHGMGGSGKTTLVQMVLNQVTVPGKFKPNIIWICLSDLTKEDEIDIKIVKYILHDLGFDIDSLPGNGHDEDDDGWLMKQLEQELHKLRNYVLVLDDVWHCNEWLTGFYHTLSKTTSGNVIVTSRIEEVARKIVGRENTLIHLYPSDDDKNYEFLKEVVRRESWYGMNYGANEIIQECHGLPLAANKLFSLSAPIKYVYGSKRLC